MSNELPRRNLESLKKEAKRWRDAILANDAGARARLQRAVPDPPASPALRHVQLALAREHGFAGWAALKEAVAQSAGIDAKAGVRTLALYSEMADALLEAYRTGTPDAMERHYRFTWHRRAWHVMRTYVQLDLGKRPNQPGDDVDITLDDARHLVALEYGFADWSALEAFTKTATLGPRVATRPVRLVVGEGLDDWHTIATSRDWDDVIRLLAQQPSAARRRRADDGCDARRTVARRDDHRARVIR